MQSGENLSEKIYSKPIEERVRYYQNYTVLHPAMKEVYEELIDRIYNANNNSIIMVCGPSGVGKSTLLAKVIERIIKDHKEEMEKDKGFIPVFGVEAIPPDTGSFDWKDFYTRALQSINEPLIDYKFDWKDSNTRLNTKAGLRRSLENAIKYRRPKALLIDEAHHMTKAVSGRNLINQMEVLKSLASTSETPIILFGTYDLLGFRNLSGQLSRRGNDIHLKRYMYNNEADIRCFVNVLKAFQAHMPLENEPDLISHWEYFYERTIGCVGILKDWLTLTLKICLSKNPNCKTLYISDFEKYGFSDEQCIILAKEASQGETNYKQPKDKKLSTLRTYLGMDTNQTLENKEHSENPKSKKNTKPGQRNPKRDQVGEGTVEIN